jgi:hypothetical protein
MAYQGGATAVSATAGVICSVPFDGNVLVQNNGTAAVTLGGAAGITAGTGVILPANMTSPVLVPTGVVHGQLDADDRLYGRTANGTSSVGYLVAG